MFETLEKKIFKDMETQLSNYYCKHIDIEVIPVSKELYKTKRV
jgi:hypothetical protein